ncbi:universal stress protein [Streptomyces sp. NPDC003710]
MELPLVVGVDGSDSSLMAVDWATDEAAMHGLPLRLVHGSLWERYEHVLPSSSPQRPAAQVMADNIVAIATDRAHHRNPDVKVATDVLPQDPADVLVRQGNNATAVVMGFRGRSELKDMLLGSVSFSVVGRACGPVIVVRGGTEGREGRQGRIVLGAGEPGTSSSAVCFALREAEARHCALDVVRSWRRPSHEPIEHPLLAGNPALYYEERAATVIDALLQDPMADHPDLPVNRVTVEGFAHKVLLDRTAAADLVIIGARRRHGRLGCQLGRVAHMLLHHAECPVAVVPRLP